MTDKIIPANVSLAAKRGFIRTASQSIATALGGGITAAAVLQVVNGEIPVVAAVVISAVAAATPLINGAAAYFSILGKGIPEEYAPNGYLPRYGATE